MIIDIEDNIYQPYTVVLGASFWTDKSTWNLFKSVGNQSDQGDRDGSQTPYLRLSEAPGFSCDYHWFFTLYYNIVKFYNNVSWINSWKENFTM